jgi:tRNA pseudouridine38-40 synthase
MLKTIKLTIEYDGRQFSGWQMQAPEFRTVQGEIQTALTKILKEKTIILGSGRTDQGVHARGQVAHFRTHSEISLEKLFLALNGTLPADIAIVKIEKVSQKFHAQFSVKSKTYRYTILNRKGKSALYKNYSFHHPFPINLTLLKKEAKSLVGRKDFKSFQSSDPAKRSIMKKHDTIRTIKNIKITKQGDLIHIDITANGFLYKMVRNIVGTLLDINADRLPQKSLTKILSKKNRIYAGNTAKSWGLTLWEVQY